MSTADLSLPHQGESTLLQQSDSILPPRLYESTLSAQTESTQPCRGESILLCKGNSALPRQSNFTLPDQSESKQSCQSESISSLCIGKSTLSLGQGESTPSHGLNESILSPHQNASTLPRYEGDLLFKGVPGSPLLRHGENSLPRHFELMHSAVGSNHNSTINVSASSQPMVGGALTFLSGK